MSLEEVILCVFFLETLPIFQHQLALSEDRIVE